MTEQVAESHGKSGFDGEGFLFGEDPGGPPGSDSGERQAATLPQTSMGGVLALIQRTLMIREKEKSQFIWGLKTPAFLRLSSVNHQRLKLEN